MKNDENDVKENNIRVQIPDILSQLATKKAKKLMKNKTKRGKNEDENITDTIMTREIIDGGNFNDFSWLDLFGKDFDEVDECARIEEDIKHQKIMEECNNVRIVTDEEYLIRHGLSKRRPKKLKTDKNTS